MKPLAIDLFCGLGGWSQGLLATGWDVIGFDIEEHAYDGERYPAQLVLQDARTLHGSQFKGADLIVASPPCQRYSYMAMPWSLAKAQAAKIRADQTGAELLKLNELFMACFRIQREASEAAGRHIPMVVENVRGAQPWVGKARWNFGSYYLWGDVPALMPPPVASAAKVPGFRFDGSGGSFQTAAVKTAGAPHIRDDGEAHTKHLTNPGEHGRKHHGDWFRDPDCPSRQGGQVRPPARVSERGPTAGRKSVGSGAVWFDQNIASLPSNSPRRKAASARIAKIPPVLAEWVGRCWLPEARVLEDALSHGFSQEPREERSA